MVSPSRSRRALFSFPPPRARRSLCFFAFVGEGGMRLWIQVCAGAISLRRQVREGKRAQKAVMVTGKKYIMSEVQVVFTSE